MSLGNVSAETLLPEIDVAREDEAVLVETAPVTWSNAAIRPVVVERFASLGARVLPAIEAALAPPRLPPFSQSNTAIVTAIAVLEALGTRAAKERLLALAADPRPVAAAHARAALERLGEKPTPRETPRGPTREELERQLAGGKPKERALALAHVPLHTDLALLAAVRAALDDGAAVVREEAARTCGRLGDAACFDVLHRRLRERPPPPTSSPRGGALPEKVRDALGAWNALAELGDVRAFGEIARFEAEGAYAPSRSKHGDQAATTLFERHPAARWVTRR